MARVPRRRRPRLLHDPDRLGLSEREALMLLLGLYGAHMNDQSVPIPVSRRLAARIVAAHLGVSARSPDVRYHRIWRLWRLLLTLIGYSPIPPSVNYARRWFGDV